MRILLLSPENGFPKEKLDEIKEVFENNNMTLEHHQEPLEEVSGFNGFIIAGDETLLDADFDVIKKAIENIGENAVFGAVDCGPLILAMAGLLVDKCATGNNKFERQMEDLGVMYFDDPVVTDENIVTSNSPDSAADFANVFVQLLG